MKKIISILLVTTLLALSMSVGVLAGSLPFKGKGDGFTFEITKGKVLIIEGTGGIPEFFTTDYVDDYRQDIEEIIIKDGITGVGFGAFEGLNKVKKATVAASVGNLSESSFGNVPEKLIIKGANTSINEDVFGEGEDKPQVTIYGVKGSKAEEFAKKKNISFVVYVAAPEKVKATNVKKKSVVVKYAKADGAKSYKIQCSTSSKFKNALTKSTSKLTVKFTKLKKGKKYYIRVRGLNGKQAGAWSSTVKVVIKK